MRTIEGERLRGKVLAVTWITTKSDGTFEFDLRRLTGDKNSALAGASHGATVSATVRRITVVFIERR